MGKPLKIFYYNRAINTTEGAAIHARELLTAFRELGLQVVCEPEPLESEKVNYAHRAGGWIQKSRHLEILRELLRLGRGAYISFRDFIKIKRALRIEDFNFILTRNIEYNIAALLASVSCGVPLLVEVNALVYFERINNGKREFWRLRKLLEKLNIEKAMGVYVVSSELKSIMASENITPKNLCIVPNGVDLKKFNKRIEKRRNPVVKTKESDMVIGFVGSLKRWHGVDLLIRAFAEIQKAHRNTVLLIIGDGKERESLEQLCRELKIQKKVLFYGAVKHEDIPSLISIFDIAVAPYREEGPFYFSPLKIFEYMGMGKPIVCSNVGQIRDLIRSGRDGILVKPNSVTSLTEGIMELLNDKEKTYKMGQQAYAKVKQSYTWKKCAEKIISFYENIS